MATAMRRGAEAGVDWWLARLVLHEETRAGMTLEQHAARPFAHVQRDHAMLDSLDEVRAYWRAHPPKE